MTQNMTQNTLQNRCASNLQTLLPWLRYYLRGLLKAAPAGTLNINEIRILARVFRFPGLSLQCLADDLGIHKATASIRVEQLVEQGLLERRVNPHSRREIQLAISPQGLSAYKQAKDYLKTHLVAQMSQFSEDELQSLEKGLGLLARMVSQTHPELGNQLAETEI
ncbi:MAG: MarR family transcriptional regulator [Candidatus Sericytochromatia bacterium]|nr:MarR family transcriptional regulator [Candidatus Sericytochromatia bacterium]